MEEFRIKWARRREGGRTVEEEEGQKEELGQF